MGSNRPRITVKEKILVHLLDFGRFSEAVEVPVSMAQKGMAVIIGVPRSHIALTLGGMLEEDLVEVEKARVMGESRRQNTYRLTHIGHQKAIKLKAYFEETVVEIMSGEKSMGLSSIYDIRKEYKNASLILILNSLDEDMRIESDVLKNLSLKMPREVPSTPKPPASAEPTIAEPPSKSDRPLPPPPPEMAFRKVYCHSCKSSYALQFEGPANAFGCPFCGYGPLFERVKVERPWLIPFTMILGLGVVFASLLITFVFPEGLCLVYPWGSLFGFSLFLWGLWKVGTWEGIGRKALYFSGGTFAIASISLFGLVLNYYEPDSLGSVFLVCIPPLAVLMLPRPIPVRHRFTLSVLLAVLLILFGFGLALGLEVQGWDPFYSILWVGFGLCSILLAMVLKDRSGVAIWPLMLFSSGIFIIGIVVLLLVSSSGPFAAITLIALCAWTLLGITLASSLFERANWSERVVNGVKHGTAFALGLGFAFFGIILLTIGKYLEGGIELVIGLPLLWFGAKDAVSHLLPSRLYIMVLLSVVEIATIIALVWA